MRIKGLIGDIIDTNASSVNHFKVIDLSDDNQLHQSADIFKFDSSYLFMRASNQKPSGAFLQRNYSDYVPAAVFDGTSETEKGIEQYTYLYLNYSTGIVGIVSQQGAPNVKVLNAIFSK